MCTVELMFLSYVYGAMKNYFFIESSTSDSNTQPGLKSLFEFIIVLPIKLFILLKYSYSMIHIHIFVYYERFQSLKVLRSIYIKHFYSYSYILIFVLYFFGHWVLQNHTGSELMSSLILSTLDCGDHTIFIRIFC